MPMQMTGGCGSSANPTYYGNVEIRILIKFDTGALQTLSFTTLIGFTAGMEAQGIGLLGGVGFFENYVVTFDHKNNLFHIEIP